MFFDFLLKRRKTISFSLLGVVLLLGLYVRIAGLDRVQHFQGDQGRDYMEMMNWLQRGEWPLLGPMRIVGDYSIGPGWFYVLAPAMGLSRFHPAAGAATIALFGIATIFLSWFWVRKITGKETAALATAMVFAWSPSWVETHRTLWNPHMLPFVTVAFACLLEKMEHRPIPCLVLSVMLVAIVPHWHSMGFLLIAAVLPFCVWGLARARAQVNKTARWTRIAWGGALLLVVASLYVPPLLYELKPGPGNLATYISKTMVPTPPSEASILQRARTGTTLLARETIRLSFEPLLTWHIFRWLAVGLLTVLFLAASFKTRHRRANLSVAYLTVLLLLFLIVLTIKGNVFYPYFLMPVLPVPILLGGWTAGRLLTIADEKSKGWKVAGIAGWLLVASAFAAAAYQLPASWNIHQGFVWHGNTFTATHKIAGFIAEEAGDSPFSLVLIQPGNFPAHFHYLLRRLGHPPENEDYYPSGPAVIPRNLLGATIYVIARERGCSLSPRLKGLLGPIDPPEEVEDSLIYRIPSKIIPKSASSLKVSAEGDDLLIRVQF